MGTIELHHILSYKQKQKPRPNSPVEPQAKDSKLFPRKEVAKSKTESVNMKKKKMEQKKKKKANCVVRRKTKENGEESVGEMISSFDPESEKMEHILHSTKREKEQIIDELDWDEIPKQPEDVSLEEELLSLNEQDLKM